MQWKDRFSPGFEPRFGTERRLWNHNDARDFTERDRTIYAAAYDTMVAYTDTQVGRLLAALRSEDPELRSVLVAVVSDHGEELGEEGRIKHSGSLAEGVQHVPFVLAGGGILPGQQFEKFSQNVDVTPTIARLLGVDGGLPDLSSMGSLSSGKMALPARPVAVMSFITPGSTIKLCGLHAGCFASIPRGLRKPSVAADGNCFGVFTARPGSRFQFEGHYALVAAKLRRKIERHVGRREIRFHSAPRRVPDRRFQVPAEYWRLAPDSLIGCRSSVAGFDADAVAGPGWHYVRKSFFIREWDSKLPLHVTVGVPNGRYDVELGVVPIRRLWWLPGFGRWLRASFYPLKAERFIPLGTYDSGDGRLTVAIPPALAQGQRVLSLRLSPQGASAAPDGDGEIPLDREQLERLRTLGYVE